MKYKKSGAGVSRGVERSKPPEGVFAAKEAKAWQGRSTNEGYTIQSTPQPETLGKKWRHHNLHLV